GKGKDLGLVDALALGLENLAGGEIFQILFVHLLAHAVFRRGRTRDLLDHEPPAMAAALIRPNAQSATAKAMNTPVSWPLQRKARKPPPAAIKSRVKLARKGHSRRPAPCEAK